jgi:hypothetical protein
MLGATGSGKSYYGNGLLGATNPCPPIHSTIHTNYFGCGKSSDSVTKNVKAQYGKYFGDIYREYGVKPMEVNIYDTPGFFDSDPNKIIQNKRLIAKQLDIEIDAFIFLLGENPRINSNTQKIFSTLHEWTLGRVWSNFVVAYGRTTFDHVDMLERAKDNENFIGDQLAKLDEIKDKLWDIAERENWHIRLLDGADKKMVKTDFDHVKISLLNVAQNKYCNTTANDGMIKENELCWKIPRREPANLGDYENSYMDHTDYDTYWDVDGAFGMDYDEVSYAPDSEYFHIKNMKILQDYILEFTKNPVKTQKEEIKKDLANDVKSFELEFESVLRAEEQLSEMFNNSDINTEECEQESKTILDQQMLQMSCPRWSSWESGECSTECGPGSITGNRTCLDGNNQPIEVELCQKEYKNDADATRRDFCNLGECGWAEWTPGECSKNCGGGTRQYNRHCNGIGCQGRTVKSEPCNTNDCEWSGWELSIPCNKKCGTGEKLLTRRCNGTGCVGKNTKIESCTNKLCEWNNWTVSQKTKMLPNTDLMKADIIKRSYIDKEMAAKAYCPKCDTRKDIYELVYYRDCNGHNCSTTDKTLADSEEIIIGCELLKPCEWGDWNVVKGFECKETPDPTTCANPSESIWSRTCSGVYCEPEGIFKTSETKTEQCTIISCDWKTWSAWSTCDKTCGIGDQARNRECNGKYCIGRPLETQKCNTQKCPSPTRLSWTIDHVDHAVGTFGFTIYGKSVSGRRGVLHSKSPSYVGGSGYVDVFGDVERLIFKTSNNDGAHLIIKLTKDGLEQPFVCKNCLPNSPSLKLGRLYLDGDMNGPQNLASASNCQNSCEFVKGSQLEHNFPTDVPVKIRVQNPSHWLNAELTWDTTERGKHGIATVQHDDPCDWWMVQKMVDGEKRYIIKAAEPVCTCCGLCAAELSWDGRAGGHPRGSVEYNDRVHWRIIECTMGRKGYHIINTHGGYTHKWFGAQLSYDGRGSDHPYVSVEFNDPECWTIE